MTVQAPENKPQFHPSKIQFAYFSLVLAWAANILFFFATSNPSLISAGNDGIKLADFLTFFEAAKLSALGSGLYDFKTQVSCLNQIIAPLHMERAWAIPYPPTFFFLLTPLSLLSLTDAYTWWKFLSIAASLAGTYILLTTQKRFSKVDWAAILISVIANIPALDAIITGQFSLFLLALVCLYVFGLSEKRHFISGFCLGLLAVTKPHYALFLSIPAITMRRGKLLVTTALFVLTLVIASSVRYGWSILPEYLRYLTDVEGHLSDMYAGVFPEYQVNLRALILYRLLHWTSLETLAVFGVAVLLTGLSITGWLWIKASRRAELFGWSMACTIILLLLCGPHVHHHDCVILIVAAILTIPSVSFAPVFKEKDWSYRIWCVILLLYPLMSFVNFSLLAFHVDLKIVVILGTNVVLGISALTYWHRLQRRPPAPLPGSSPSSA